MTNFTQADTYSHSPYVELYQTSNFIPTTGGFNKMPFDTVVANETGAWSLANSWFVAPKAGRLQINTGVYFALGAAGAGAAHVSELKVANSGGTYIARRFGQYNDYPGGFLSVVGTTTVNVNVGDRVWLDVFTSLASTIGGSASAGGTQLTHITLHYLT